MRQAIIFWLILAIILSSFPILSGASVEHEPRTLLNPELSSSQDDGDGNDSRAANRIALIDTSYGVITIELYEHRAPITTANFINLSIAAFYDGLLFHRVIDDFVIQTGDPNTRDNNPYNDGSGGSAETIPLEIHPELTHVDGAVGMARSTDPDSASSQFYICDGPQHQLDGNYAVFGVVIDGIDVVRKIAQVDTWGNKRPLLKDHPIEDVYMYSVFITENNSEFQSTPPEEDDWFLGDTFRTPGFDTGIIICSIVVIVFLLSRKRYTKRSGR